MESHPTPPSGDPISTARTLRIAAAIAVGVALLVSTNIQLSMIDHGHDWWRLFVWQLAGWGFWALASPWAVRSGAALWRASRRSRAVGAPSRWWPQVARQGAIVLGLAAVHIPLVAGVFAVLQPYVPMSSYTFTECLVRAVRFWPHLDLLAYGIGLAVGYGLAGSREARRSELRESRLATELARAQLETLRLQIQPHFLFNTLHSIAALLRRRSNDRALAMLLGLSELLRSTLERSELARVPLADELEVVRLYVDLQQARFADRLTVDYDVAEGCLPQPVPNLVLQPLVENAIRHGIAPRAAPGRIEIGAQLDAGRLQLTVADDGLGLPEDFDPAAHEGVGLGNTRSRIEQLYGGEATFSIRGREAGGTIATVRLPVEAESVADAAPPARAAAG